MLFTRLTDAGRLVAEHRAETDLVARVALYGSQSGWPDAHVQTAIKVMNELAERVPENEEE